MKSARRATSRSGWSTDPASRTSNGAKKTTMPDGAAKRSSMKSSPATPWGPNVGPGVTSSTPSMTSYRRPSSGIASRSAYPKGGSLVTSSDPSTSS